VAQFGDVVALMGMWWFSGDVVAQWECGSVEEMWWLNGDVVVER
jgi:hypothetical protein